MLNTKPVTFDFDEGLFRALCIHNMQKIHTIAEDTEFAVGYSLQRYVTQTYTIRNPHISYEHLDIHVLLAQITMSKLQV